MCCGVLRFFVSVLFSKLAKVKLGKKFFFFPQEEKLETGTERDGAKSRRHTRGERDSLSLPRFI